MDRNLYSEISPGKLVPCTNRLDKPDWAFIPETLPPAFEIPPDLWPLIADARDSLGTLNGIGQKLPNPQLLLRPTQQREAISSSRIEGTYVSAKQYLLYELDPPDVNTREGRAADWVEVSNYTQALKRGLVLLNDQGLPFCLRIIREMHELLMQGAHGEEKSPGNFRRVNAQIGSEARFIPVPWQKIDELMNDLEKYLNSDLGDVSRNLIRCFIAHYQFETIHPFEDGNGRVGRALLALMISRSVGHTLPWLYLSVFFEKFRDEYVDKMFRVSTKGEWKEWIEFCLRATIWQASDSIVRVARLCDLKDDFYKRNTSPGPRDHEIIESLFAHPVLSAVSIRDNLGISYNTARRDLDRLVTVGILREIDATKQKTFFAPEVMDLAFGDLPQDDDEPDAASTE